MPVSVYRRNSSETSEGESIRNRKVQRDFDGGLYIESARFRDAALEGGERDIGARRSRPQADLRQIRQNRECVPAHCDTYAGDVVGCS
jgi:hypothetical protein